MTGALPDGEPAPLSGELPASALVGLGERPLGLYVHVPFCATRCGYCDFNTYTPAELGPAGTTLTSYPDAVAAELDLAARVLGPVGPLDTVFVGGGTPTMLPTSALAAMLDGIRERFALAPGVEVTTEANPDSVSADSLAELARAGVTRVSLGMQSDVPHVLRVLERTHDPANVARAVAGARAAGLAVSLDLIYGTPGESLQDWRASLERALALEPDHLSAYALVVEDGTRLAGRVRRGLVPPPEDDDEAHKYEMADAVLGAAGYAWYEVSNWARTPADRCRHNLGYWRDGDWWGVGPGAHSHVGGVRWWNRKHPARYAEAVAAGRSPAQGREVLTAEERATEAVLLRVRLAEGISLRSVPDAGRGRVPTLVADGLVELVDGTAQGRAGTGHLGVAQHDERRRLRLTLRGRLLADLVVRRLLGWEGREG